MVNSTRGRPPGESDVRERLLEAARTLFLRDGYAATSVRAVARQAGVDHAMVNYYFGSKQSLFGEVMALSMTPRDVLDRLFVDLHREDPLTVARRAVATIAGAWDQEVFREPVANVLRQAFQDEAVRLSVGQFLQTEIVAHVAELLGGRDATRRAAGVGTVVGGMILTRHLLRVEPMASMPVEDVVRTLAPMLALQLRQAR